MSSGKLLGVLYDMIMTSIATKNKVVAAASMMIFYVLCKVCVLRLLVKKDNQQNQPRKSDEKSLYTKVQAQRDKYVQLYKKLQDIERRVSTLRNNLDTK